MAVDPWASTNQGLSNLSNTFASLAQLRQQDAQTAEKSKLAALQAEAAQQSIDQNKLTLADAGAKQSALVDLYGTAKHTNPLASAYSFQVQEEKDATQQKAIQEKQKHAFDVFTKVAKAVDDGVIDSKAATDYYHNAMKLEGLDLDGAGVKLEFQKQKGGYFSGPVASDSLFMINGKPTPYGAQGIVSKARIVGQDEQSGKPIFEMDENTTFAEAKPDQEALIDKRFEQQQKLQRERESAADSRTQKQIEAADRRAAAAERRTANKPDPTDALVAREAVKDLPKLRREARTAEATKPRLTQMVKLIDSGAGGLKGNALAAVSTFFDTPATSDADLFKKLASAGAGQLRASVIGPGPVSNYEQTLLQSVSGGGRGAVTAIRQLLKYYEQEADRTIDNYNDAVDSAATVAPKVVKGFGKVGGKKKDPLGIL